MKRSNMYLSLTLIFTTALTLTGCIVAPLNNSYGYNPNKVNLSLLHNIDESEADRRLSAKDFHQVRTNEPGNTKWLNSRTNQCVEVLSNGGNKVSSVVERDLQFCNEHSGHNSGHNHHAGSSEWNRGCADAQSGSYDRSGNAGQGYEKGWQACKGQ